LRVARRQLKRGFNSACPFHKETDRIVAEQARPCSRLRWIGETQRRDAQDRFTADRERLTAGRKQHQPWTACQQDGDDTGTFLNHMFTVVQHQEQAPGLQKRAKPLNRRQIGSLGQCEHCGDGVDHQV